MATYSEIVARVVANVGRSDKQSTVEALVNEQIQAICQEHNFWFMEEVVGRMLLSEQHKYALPSDFKDWGEVVLLEHGGLVRPGGTIAAVSDAAGDTTQTLTVTFIDYVGDLRTESQALNGTESVPFSAGMAQIRDLTLDAACAGTVTVSTSGAALATLAAGETLASYRVSIDSSTLEGPRTEGYCLSHFGLLDEGTPTMFSDDRGELRVWPPLPDADDKYSLRLRYYRILPSLSGVQTNEITTRWPQLLVARVCEAFYAGLPNAGKLAQEWRNKVNDPVTGMRSMIRASNTRQLAEHTNNVRERIQGRLGRSWHPGYSR